MNAESIKVAQHSGPDGDEIKKTAVGCHGGPFHVSLYFRHELMQTVPHSGGFAQQVFAGVAGRMTRKEEKKGCGVGS